MRLFPIKNEHAEVLGLMMALSDITERKKAEHKLQAAYEQIQSQMNHIKEMAWKQSHLIRSPIANLKGLANVLKTDPTDANILAFMNRELCRLDDIIIELADNGVIHYSS